MKRGKRGQQTEGISKPQQIKKASGWADVSSLWEKQLMNSDTETRICGRICGWDVFLKEKDGLLACNESRTELSD